MYRKRKSLHLQKKSIRQDKSNSRIIVKNISGKKSIFSHQRKSQIQPINSSHLKQKQSEKPLNDNIFITRQQQIYQTPKVVPFSKRKNDQHLSLMDKLNQLDRKAQEILYRKLVRKMRYDKKLSLKNNNNSDIDREIDKLLKQVKQLSQDSIDYQIGTQVQDYNFRNKKINLMEKLMAEQSIEAQGLKKDFFTISALNQKKKFQSLNPHTYKKDPIKILMPRSNSRSITDQSTSKMSFKAPNKQDYEQYRYKQKQHVSNRQPYPRSSYKSEYLQYMNEQQNMPCKNIDSFKYLNKSRQKSSSYAKDYKTIKTQVMNYKQLDSYRNKLRDIKISYTMKKPNPEEDLVRRKRIMTQQLYSLPVKKQERKYTQNIKIMPKINLTSQSKRQFPSLRFPLFSAKSQIKNKQLTKLKYSYKGLAHV